MKTTGREFKQWLASDWGPDAFWDDYEVRINGEEVDDYSEEEIADDDKVEILSGVVILDDRTCKSISATAHFRKWKKAQTTETLVIEVDRAKADEFKRLSAEFGAKVA